MPALMEKIVEPPPRMPTHRKITVLLVALYLVLAWAAIIAWACGEFVGGLYCVIGALACGVLAVNLCERCD